MAGTHTQARANRGGLRRVRYRLDRHAGTACAPDGDSVATQQCARALRVLRLTDMVVRRAGLGVVKGRRHINKRIRPREGRASDLRPGSAAASRRRRRRTVREHKAASIRSGVLGRQTTRAADAGRAAGDVVGRVTRTDRTILAAGVGVAELRARIVPAGAVVLGSLEELEHFEGSLVVGLGVGGCDEGAVCLAHARSRARSEECGRQPDPPRGPHSDAVVEFRRVCVFCSLWIGYDGKIGISA